MVIHQTLALLINLKLFNHLLRSTLHELSKVYKEKGSKQGHIGPGAVRTNKHVL